MFNKKQSFKEIKKYNKKYVEKINNLESEIEILSDEQLKEKTLEFKSKLESGKSLDDILIEAFAVVREASKRVLGLRHFDVQLLGGVLLHQGKVAEMRTGEGKTLVATLPAYLNALKGKGVHIITVNDYLAKRDLEIMKPLYDFLGLTSSYVISTTDKDKRKELYKADIIYTTNNEVGFDYLRDNMVFNLDKKVLRSLDYVIIDEIDSILIDEARTPLIITTQSDKPSHLYSISDVFVKSLKKDDYLIDKESSAISLTEEGVKKVESIFSIENFSDYEHNLLRHHINQALRANYVMKKDKNYIIKNNEIIIIDEFTGRLGYGRRFSNGLHQAIEAKEGVNIKPESITLAQITYQNFFKMYKKLSGMTGTAETEKLEFETTYGLNVVVVPTNKPIQRIDREDKIFFTEQAKIKSVIEDIKTCYEKGQPVLVGTQSIDKSEELSEILKKEGIKHNVLNAKNHEIESEIIKKAGEKKAVTIATNMAGRGTDIKITEEAKELGGLKIIGTERSENRRIDNQLKGRSGRQGDIGESQFYLSFDDEIIKFISKKAENILKNIDKSSDSPVSHKILSKSIDMCQSKIESIHYQIRKNTLEYDNVVNKQRSLIYSQRDSIMGYSNEEFLDQLCKITQDVITNNVLNKILDFKDVESIKNELEPHFFKPNTLDLEYIKELKEEKDVCEYIISKAIEVLKEKSKIDNFYDIARNIFLKKIDECWMENLIVLEDLKEEVRFEGLRGVNPITTYITKSYEIFESMVSHTKLELIKYIFKFNIIK